VTNTLDVIHYLGLLQHNVSETESVSFFRWGERMFILLCYTSRKVVVHLSLSNDRYTVYVTLPLE